MIIAVIDRGSVGTATYTIAPLPTVTSIGGSAVACGSADNTASPVGCVNTVNAALTVIGTNFYGSCTSIFDGTGTDAVASAVITTVPTKLTLTLSVASSVAASTLTVTCNGGAGATGLHQVHLHGESDELLHVLPDP